MRSVALALYLGILCGCEYDAEGLGSTGPSIDTTMGPTSGTTTPSTTTAVDSSTSALPDTGTTLGPPGTTTGIDSTTGEGSSDSTGTPSPLVDNGLLARWFIDEANAGQTPTELLDVTMLPVALSLTYPDRVMTFDEQGGNRGLRWMTTGNSGRPSALIGGTKLETQLATAQQATIELVLDVEAVLGVTSRFIHFGVGGTSQLVLGARALDSLEFRWGALVAREFAVDLTGGRQVIHLVIDTTQVRPIDRIRAHRNGTPLDVTFIDMGSPAQGEGLPLTNTASLTLGNRGNGQRSFAGRLGYAALYTQPLSPSELTQNADALGESDDTQ